MLKLRIETMRLFGGNVTAVANLSAPTTYLAYLVSSLRDRNLFLHEREHHA